MPDLDEALAQVRRDLRAEAGLLADTDATLAAIRSNVRYSKPPSNTGRYLAFAAAAIMVIGGLVAISWVTSDEADPSDPIPSLVPPPTATASASVAPTIPPPITDPGTTPTTIPSTTTTTTSTTTPGVPVQVGSTIDSFFVDTMHGWLTSPTSDVDFQTLQTLDGGATWVPVSSMPAGVIGVRFADTANGWAFDYDSLWSTHDGGATWNEFVGLAGDLSGQWNLAIAGDQVYIAIAPPNGVGLDVSPITSDDVTHLDVVMPYGAGPVVEVSLAAHADALWMVYNDRTVAGSVRIIGGNIDASWVPPASDQGGPVHVYSATAGGPLWAIAQTGIWSGDMENPRTILYVSDDQGDTFREVTPPGLGDRATSFEVAVAGPSDVVVATPWGDAGTTLLHSGDEGATWSQIANVPGVGIGALQYQTPSAAVATVNFINDGHQGLWRSDDGGATWRALAIGTVTP